MATELLIPTERLCSVTFSTYSSDEIKKISCKRITNVNTFDSLMHPNSGGLYDVALGPADKLELCGTCGLNYVHCPGHMGHIQLPLPVYHPVFFTSLYRLLKCTCFNCCKLLATKLKTDTLIAQLKLLEGGYYSVANMLENEGEIPDEVEDILKQCQQRRLRESSDNVTSKHVVELRRYLVDRYFKEGAIEKEKCPHCGCPVRKLRQQFGAKIFHRPMKSKQGQMWVHMRNENNSGREFKEDHSKKEQLILPLEAKQHMEKVWQNDNVILSLLFGQQQQRSATEKVNIFFLSVIPVPPSRFRPVSQVLFRLDLFIQNWQPVVRVLVVFVGLDTGVEWQEV